MTCRTAGFFVDILLCYCFDVHTKAVAVIDCNVFFMEYEKYCIFYLALHHWMESHFTFFPTNTHA